VKGRTTEKTHALRKTLGGNITKKEKKNERRGVEVYYLDVKREEDGQVRGGVKETENPLFKKGGGQPGCGGKKKSGGGRDQEGFVLGERGGKPALKGKSESGTKCEKKRGKRPWRGSLGKNETWEGQNGGLEREKGLDCRRKRSNCYGKLKKKLIDGKGSRWLSLGSQKKEGGVQEAEKSLGIAKGEETVHRSWPKTFSRGRGKKRCAPPWWGKSKLLLLKGKMAEIRGGGVPQWGGGKNKQDPISRQWGNRVLNQGNPQTRGKSEYDRSVRKKPERKKKTASRKKMDERGKKEKWGGSGGERGVSEEQE